MAAVALTAALCATGGSVLPQALGTAAATPTRVRHHRAPEVIADPAPTDRPNAFAASVAPPAPPLPPAVSAPLPAPPAVTATVLRPHEVFGFAPYWTLGSSGGFDLADLTTVAYFGVDAAADGSLVQSGPGWNGYQSQALADLISRAHGAGDRVVLTVECFDQPALDRLTSDPAADARLADGLIAAVRAKSLDGVNLDFEGLGSADRPGLVRLVDYLSSRLRAADPHWQFTVDTYAGSATDPNGFFDVGALAPAVDAFFVMAYDMYRPGTASPNAPLGGGSPSDQAAVEGYLAAVPASKVVLGVPFYGYEWQTTDNAPRASATSSPVPVSYAQVAAANMPVYWDPQGAVPWSEFKDAKQQWHEVYYDDPQSVGLKAKLADAGHLLGVGIWALGMDGNNPAMMAALLGHAPVLKSYPAGPSTVSPSGQKPPGSTTTTSSSTTSSTTSTTQPSHQTLPAPPSGGGGGGGSGGGSGGGGGGGGGGSGGSPPITLPSLFGGSSGKGL